MSRRNRIGMLLNPEIAVALLVDRMEEALDRFGQEMPVMTFYPAMFADAIAELTRRKPWIIKAEIVRLKAEAENLRTAVAALPLGEAGLDEC